MGEIRSPYFSRGGDYLGDNAEIQSPFFSFGTRDYHGDNADIHSLYFSVGDYHEEDAEIPSETFYHQEDDVENPYSAGQDVVPNILDTGKLNHQKNSGEVCINIAARRLGKKKDEPKKADSKKESPGLECIYRVPVELRKSMEAIYTPRKISIGPIHNGTKSLQPMEQQKDEYFEAFRKRGEEKTEEQIEKFVEKLENTVRKYEPRIRQCYAPDAHKLDGCEFLEIVLFDAVFILEYLLRNKDKNKYEEDDKMGELEFWIRWDLTLLENQLPFFILEELYGHLVEDSEEDYTPFRDLACEYFNGYNKSPYKPREILHFTGLVRSLLSGERPSTTGGPIENFYSATKLHEAGIKLKESGKGCLLDVEFTSTNGKFSIPRLQIDRYTECIFGNLMAFEKRHCKGEDQYICHYVKLLDTLIAKPKDADLLIKNKIIKTRKDGAAVDILIKKLSAETSEDCSCYNDTYKRLDGYYQKHWLKNRAYFRRTFFGNVWIGTATVSASILLLLTLVQAICSVLSLI